MIDRFFLNGYLWHIRVVDPDSPYLIDRTNKKTLATTDPVSSTIYISNHILCQQQLFTKVLLHELGHCAMLSFDLIGDIHRMVKPEYWIEAEEWICNYIADYGTKIFTTFYIIVGDDAIRYVPRELNRMFA